MTEPLPELDPERLPRHIAVIMDGNGRWAKREGVGRAAGHEAGAKSARAVIEACRELEHVKALTLYAFSTENWRRSKMEVSALFRLLSKYIGIELDSVHEQSIRITTMGRLDDLPERARRDMTHAMELTANNTAMTVNVALNYGSRDEITRAVRSIAEDVKAGTLSPEAVDDALIASRLDTAGLPELDLLIRTSGEMRVSNFMLWQLSYAEIHVTPTLWPDFRKPHLYEAIADYQARERRYGGRKRAGATR
jgi:undecaprenyl diphosphate synthase